MIRPDPSTNIARRDVLKTIVTAAGAAGLAPGAVGVTDAAAAPDGAPASRADPAPPPAPGYQSLSLEEAAFVEALVNIMCPADHLTPSGVDCGLAVYIDRQLAGAFGQGYRLYRSGPWRHGLAELGYQLPLSPEVFFKAGVAAVNARCKARFGKNFDALPAGDADAVLREIGDNKANDPRLPLGAWFNELVYPLFTQACFADPIYGGNKHKVFWRMLGYPGLPAFHARDMVEFRGKPFPPAKAVHSIADFS